VQLVKIYNKNFSLNFANKSIEWNQIKQTRMTSTGFWIRTCTHYVYFLISKANFTDDYRQLRVQPLYFGSSWNNTWHVWGGCAVDVQYKRVSQARSQVLKFGRAKYIFKGERVSFLLCVLIKNFLGTAKFWGDQKNWGGIVPNGPQ